MLYNVSSESPLWGFVVRKTHLLEVFFIGIKHAIKPRSRVIVSCLSREYAVKEVADRSFFAQ